LSITRQVNRELPLHIRIGQGSIPDVGWSARVTLSARRLQSEPCAKTGRSSLLICRLATFVPRQTVISCSIRFA